MRRWQALTILSVALLVLGANWVPSFAGAVTSIVYSYEPTSGPVGTEITADGSCNGLWGLEMDPADPPGSQWFTAVVPNYPQRLTIPATNPVLGGLMNGFYNVDAQCGFEPFDPTYSPCGFTVTSSPGVSGRCKNVGGPNPTVEFTPRFAASDEALATAAASDLGIPLADLSRQSGYFVAFLLALHQGPLTPITPLDNSGPFTLPAEYPADLTDDINHLSDELGVTPDQFQKAAVTLVVFLASL